jgi:putative transcriptional regulator
VSDKDHSSPNGNSRFTGDARIGEPLYNRIAVLRTEHGMSRQKLADSIGINYQTLGYLERGDYNPSLELAFRLKEFFRLPIEAIFSREPFRPLSDQVYRDHKGNREEKE